MPTQQDSLYEQLQALTSVQKQHFVENFTDGISPNTFRWGFGTWVIADGAGNSAVMEDAVNGGIKLESSGAGTNAGITMSFLDGTATNGSDNNGVTTIPFRPYLSGLANIIFTMKFNATSGFRESGGGFMTESRADMAGINMAMYCLKAKFSLRTSNGGGTQGETASSIDSDTDWHCVKISGNVTSDPVGAGQAQRLYIDGVEEVATTSAIGWYSDRVAPMFTVNRTGTTCSANIGYCEAWNG